MQNRELDLVELGVASVETQGGPVEIEQEGFGRRLAVDAIRRD